MKRAGDAMAIAATKRHVPAVRIARMYAHAGLNGVALDWTDAWTLEMSPVELPKADILDVSVHFAQRIPLRLTTLIATGLALSRAEVTKHIAAGRVSSDRKLTGRCAQDFSFVFR